MKKIFRARRRQYVNSKRSFPKNIFVNSVPLAFDDKGWSKILPFGDFPDHPQGGHSLTPDIGAQMLRNFVASGRPLLIDHDHSSIRTDENGHYLNTEAIGWAPTIEARADGLYAKSPDWVGSWTDKIASRAYLFFSPAYDLDAKDRSGNRIGAVLDSMGVTNRPWFEYEIDPIPNSKTTEESEMFTKEELPALRAKYGLPETATDAEIKAAILNGQPAPAAEKKAEVKDDDPVANSATGKALLAGIKSLTDTVAGLIANSKHTADAALEGMVDKAIADKKILPRDKAVYLNSAKADPENTRKALDAIKPNAVLGGMIDPSKAEGPDKPAFTTVANAQKSAAEFFKSSGRAPLVVKAA